MVLTTGARAMVSEAYGPLFDVQADPLVTAASLTDRLSDVPRGTPYVLTVLTPYPDNPIDTEDLARAVALLTDGTTRVPTGSYNAIVGRVGERPSLIRSGDRPFRVRTAVGAADLDVRMECWLPADTIRRMGFGRVVSGRVPVLTLDRGVSFVSLTEDGAARRVAYGWAILAPQPRWVLRWRE